MSKPEPYIQKVQQRTLERVNNTVTVVIPAHNEQDTIGDVVLQCRRGLDLLDVAGSIVVSASDCSDATSERATQAGAHVVYSPLGKGAAIKAGVAAAAGDIICLVDGDLEYYGNTPLVTLLVEPLLNGIADACISNLYWRPVYPDQWMHGFFAPIAGRFFPELLPKSGSTPWSGQRAAFKGLWPQVLPDDFTADLALVLHWNHAAVRFRPVITDDWFNPIRPKPDQIGLDFKHLVHHGVTTGRIESGLVANLEAWFDVVQQQMALYCHGQDDPQEHERQLLLGSIHELNQQLVNAGT